MRIPSSASTNWTALFCTAALYALLIAGSEFLFDNPQITGFFEPAAGLALAAVLVGGRNYLWAVLVGCIGAHMFVGEHWNEAIPEITADVLQTALGAWLLARNKFDWRPLTLRSYLDLLLLGGAASVTVGMLIAVSGLMLLGSTHPESWLDYMLRWWMGDMLGIVSVTPMILVWLHEGFSFRDGKEALGAMALAGITAAVGLIVFLGWMHDYLGEVAETYWLFLFVSWGAMVAGQRWVTATLLLVTVEALAGAMLGTGSFANDIAETHLANFWFFSLILSMVGMSLSSYFSEIRQARYEVSLRDTLIREIHHRIKNNLQGIAGLLRLLADTHPEIAEPIGKTIAQLKSIAAVHGIQERDAASQVTLHDLAKTIADSAGSLWQRSIDISASQDCMAYHVSPQETVPLALVINELLSNALKHGSAPGKISLALEAGASSDSVRLSISNPSTMRPDFEGREGTGMQLVKSLLPKTGAQLTWQNQNGNMVAVLDLEFPVIIPEARA